MTFAVEPKIALEGIGLIGTENTYEVTESSAAKSLTGDCETGLEIITDTNTTRRLRFLFSAVFYFSANLDSSAALFLVQPVRNRDNSATSCGGTQRCKNAVFRFQHRDPQ